jgi:hypothetical protein
MNFTTKIRKYYDRIEPKDDYLKYWRIVKYWATRKYGVYTADLDMMLFLYTERLFSRADFKEYECIFPWDKKRFSRLMQDGWIIKWRDRIGHEAAMYELSFKGKKMVSTIYRKLNNLESISESSAHNPIFSNKASYSDNMNRRIIKTMNRNNEEKRKLKKLEEEKFSDQPHIKKYRNSRGLPLRPSPR